LKGTKIGDIIYSQEAKWGFQSTSSKEGIFCSKLTAACTASAGALAVFRFRTSSPAARILIYIDKAADDASRSRGDRLDEEKRGEIFVAERALTLSSSAMLESRPEV
jgi:hypothetical protein